MARSNYVDRHPGLMEKWVVWQTTDRLDSYNAGLNFGVGSNYHPNDVKDQDAFYAGRSAARSAQWSTPSSFWGSDSSSNTPAFVYSARPSQSFGSPISFSDDEFWIPFKAFFLAVGVVGMIFLAMTNDRKHVGQPVIATPIKPLSDAQILADAKMAVRVYLDNFGILRHQKQGPLMVAFDNMLYTRQAVASASRSHEANVIARSSGGSSAKTQYATVNAPASDGIYLKQKPDKDAGRVMMMRQGLKVKIIRAAGAGWVEVEATDQAGKTHKGFAGIRALSMLK